MEKTKKNQKPVIIAAVVFVVLIAAALVLWQFVAPKGTEGGKNAADTSKLLKTNRHLNTKHKINGTDLVPFLNYFTSATDFSNSILFLPAWR